MSTKSDSLKGKLTENFSEFSQLSDYSFMNSLKADPQSTKDGNDHSLVQYIQATTYQLFQLPFLNQNIFPIATNFLKN